MTAGLSFPKTPIGCCSGCCIRRLTLTCSKKKATHKYSFPPYSTEVQETHRRRDRERKKFKNDGSGRYLRLKPVMEKLEEGFFSQIRKPSHQSKGNNGQRYGRNLGS
jgi:hypothetical protein